MSRRAAPKAHSAKAPGAGSPVSCAAVAPQEPALAATAAHLLDVAERLFARRGIDAVSLREIVRESGQNNLSAAHYHFGSRQALMGALLARRIRAINAVRHQRRVELAEHARQLL